MYLNFFSSSHEIMFLQSVLLYIHLFFASNCYVIFYNLVCYLLIICSSQNGHLPQTTEEQAGAEWGCRRRAGESGPGAPPAVASAECSTGSLPHHLERPKLPTEACEGHCFLIFTNAHWHLFFFFLFSAFSFFKFTMTSFPVN